MRDIRNDLFGDKETYCESCQYNIPGKAWCSKYKKVKPVGVMIGRTKCEEYCMLKLRITPLNFFIFSCIYQE